ncbi:MAG: nucleoside 2-deoxyribosyltransferase domain-containing protein [bacterium]|nr:nucleoside 2-deoxyribosyltransferase domain-containing protein [bacterium]
MIHIKPPHPIPQASDPKVFLAGSIEMGAAEHWQDKVVERFANEAVILLNPRRDNWDSNWAQQKDNPAFREQVAWELNALEKSDYIIMYFDPNTKSPISLLEMGLHARGGKLLVVCPLGFWRKGNVDIVCETYGISQFADLDAALTHLTSLICNNVYAK